MNKFSSLIKSLFKKNIFLILVTLFTVNFSVFAQEFYWENPIKISPNNSFFPSVVQSQNNSCIFFQEVNNKTEELWVSCRYFDGETWKNNNRFAGPYKFSGEVPDIYSATISETGIIAVAVLSAADTISIYVSQDSGKTFNKTNISVQNQTLIAPRIFATKTGRLILFSSYTYEDSFYLKIAHSDDGLTWSKFKDFSPSKSLKNSFVPSLCSTQNGEYVVFQAQFQQDVDFYQLYATSSIDNGESWTEPILLTNENSLSDYETRNANQFVNQRPFVYEFNNEVYVAWERNFYQSEKTSVWVGKINSLGLIPGSAQSFVENGISHRPVLFSFEDELYVTWFDNRSGVDLPYLAKKTEHSWNNISLPKSKNPIMFNVPIKNKNDNFVSFVWQEKSSIYILEPDTTVAKIKITPQSYKEGQRSKDEKVKIRVTMPSDSSGISGYSYVWSQDEFAMPEYQVYNLPNERNISLTADADGKWYFKAIVQDYAGNWSKVALSEYYLDLTPPHNVQINPLQTDEFNFINSNSFSISWENDILDDDIAGYNYELKYISSIDKEVYASDKNFSKVSGDSLKKYTEDLLKKYADKLNVKKSSKSKINTKQKSVYFNNYKNGLYLFSIAPIDTVGNVGETAVVPVILNKYIPKTYISSINVQRNTFGDISVDIYGEDFLYDGTIKNIYIDKDGVAPYDLTLDYSMGKFRVTSNTKISNVVIGNSLKEGNYYIGLVHSQRGLYKTKKAILQVLENGTVKIEQNYDYKTKLVPTSSKIKYYLQPGKILFAILISIVVIGIIVFVTGLIKTLQETIILSSKLSDSSKGDFMKYNTENSKKKVFSLRLKLVGFTSALVIMIILLVAIPLGATMLKTEEETLAKGLEERIDVLMESISSGARSFIPVANFLELSALPEQCSALEEAEYVTILGINTNQNNSDLFNVWASNDKDIESKINTKNILFGSSKLVTTGTVDGEDQIEQLKYLCAELNKDVETQIGRTVRQISELNAEGIKIMSKMDSKSVERKNEISRITTELTKLINEKLNEASTTGQSSFPHFDSSSVDRINKDYIFFRPIVFTQGNSRDYVRGIVLLKIKTDLLVDTIDAESKLIFYTVLVISLVAITLGIIGSLFVSSIIVKPIRNLVTHVKKIGETKKKKNLQSIKIKTKDEIGLLGQTVNKMLEDLKHAEQQEGLDMEARAVQQAFLPLGTNDDGTKQTFSTFDDKNIQAFGYYEGADGVSGDYFDYKKLDSRWYVFIKSDASGHGIPAALIMTIVALYFRQYFESWDYNKKGAKINDLVVQINEFINSLELKGKFVTLIVCLYDSKTGETYLCNAGDNLVHVFEAASKKINTIKLKETPAAGPFPLFMVDMKGGFIVEKSKLQKDDILFLYTDGIEEATRIVRDSDFKPILLPKKDGNGEIVYSKDGTMEYDKKEELLEADRVEGIIEAVLRKEKFVLQKEQNPNPSEKLEFDFTNCQGNISEAVIALCSIEKVFRMYKPSTVTVNDTIKVDKRIDDFLKKYFNLYNEYCIKAPENIEKEESNYVYYSYVMEDEQKDDLTLLAIRRQ